MSPVASPLLRESVERSGLLYLAEVRGRFSSWPKTQSAVFLPTIVVVFKKDFRFALQWQSNCSLLRAVAVIEQYRKLLPTRAEAIGLLALNNISLPLTHLEVIDPHEVSTFQQGFSDPDLDSGAGRGPVVQRGPAGGPGPVVRIPRDRYRSQRRRHCQRRSHGHQRGQRNLPHHRDHRGRRLRIERSSTTAPTPLR